MLDLGFLEGVTTLEKVLFIKNIKLLLRIKFWTKKGTLPLTNKQAVNEPILKSLKFNFLTSKNKQRTISKPLYGDLPLCMYGNYGSLTLKGIINHFHTFNKSVSLLAEIKFYLTALTPLIILNSMLLL